VGTLLGWIVAGSLDASVANGVRTGRRIGRLAGIAAGIIAGIYGAPQAVAFITHILTNKAGG
jgi:hypothetical protein